MYTKKRYSVSDMIYWTRHETFIFIVMTIIPVVIYDLLGQKWLHLPWLPIALIGTAVAFILGFQNNAVYGRLWEARKIWGGIVNASRSWAIMLNDFITNDFTEQKASDEELRSIRKTLIMRHVAWMTALRHAMRARKPWEHFMQEKTNREWSDVIGIREHRVELREELEGYLSPDEIEQVLTGTNKAALILALQSKTVRELRTRGLIDDFRHMEMQGMLTELFSLQGKSERIKNFPYPRQYATLNWVFLWIFIILLPFGVLYEFDKIGTELMPDYPILGDYFVWLAVPFASLVMWIFHTVERIGRSGENPFEGSANDVPITTMARGIEIDIRQIIGDDPSTIPGQVEPIRGVQT